MAPALLSVPHAGSLLGRAAASRFRPAAEPPVRSVNAVFRVRPGTGVAVAAARRRPVVAAAAATAEKAGKPFVEEMRVAAMRLHTRDQARDGKKEAPMEPPIAKWQPTVQGYLGFLVDSKLVFETLEAVVGRAAIPWCNRVAEKLHIQKELEFYEWEGDLSQLQQNVRAKLNQVTSGWSRAEKDRCLHEMEKAFTCSIDLRRHMFP